jgi:hypothetical protein
LLRHRPFMKLVAVETSPLRSLSFAMLRLGFRTLRLTLPILSFQSARFGYVVHDFAVTACAFRPEHIEYVVPVGGIKASSLQYSLRQTVVSSADFSCLASVGA